MLVSKFNVSNKSHGTFLMAEKQKKGELMFDSLTNLVVSTWDYLCKFWSVSKLSNRLSGCQTMYRLKSQ